MGELAQVLASISELSRTMLSTPVDDRISVYRKLDPLLLQLEAQLKDSPNPYASKKVDELKFHLIMIARLDDPDEDPDDHHYASAMDAIDALQGPQCFDLGRKT